MNRFEALRSALREAGWDAYPPSERVQLGIIIVYYVTAWNTTTHEMVSSHADGSESVALANLVEALRPHVSVEQHAALQAALEAP